jgi:hypothetical protein
MNRTFLFKISLPLIAAPLLSIFTPSTAIAALSNSQTLGLQQENTSSISNSILIADRDDYYRNREEIRNRRREIRKQIRRLNRDERRLNRRDRDRYYRGGRYDDRYYRGDRYRDRRYRDRDYNRYSPWR